MTEQVIYPVQPGQKTKLNNAQYQAMYAESLRDPEGFWQQQAQRIEWKKPFSKVKDVSFAKEDLHIRWFEDGELNVTESCLDRHLDKHGDDVAIIWEPDDESQVARRITYRELSKEVNQLANGLRDLGVKKGDVVTIYMPMVPEASMAMLACARIGAIHSVVFGGFSPEALAGRIEDGNCHYVITANEGVRAGKIVPLKENVDAAINLCKSDQVKKVVVLNHTGNACTMEVGRDEDYRQLVDKQDSECQAEVMNAEDPLFILYTSGSTGKPKGVLHTCGGYLVYASMTHEYIFDYERGDVYWCAADVGWITGHSYIVYGPFANGATVVMYEGVPTHPDCGRVARIVDKHQINILYIAPTAIRALMSDGDEPVEGASLESLRLLGTVGEPINPEAWRWYYRTFGRSQCPIVDTWWQTETGAALITPLPGATDLKPGSATRPFFGIEPALVDEKGNELSGATSGNLIIKDSWPGQMRTVFGDHQRFIDTYFSTFEGTYFTGDGAKRDEDGYFWITGRVDDVLNVSGHRMGTAEIESALVAHEAVSEAAVVGFPHDVKGQGIYVYVTLNHDVQASPAIRNDLINWVRKEIGPIASPDIIQWAPGLPKTRSGKIMRRILRKIATDEYDQLGDISTLADPSVVESLIQEHQALTESVA
ncbi:acetate--CoA ligase [Bermanella marisrubri]|uniref:Acetyl-coenzyme A synthetase n=1 Tax=Bermanella marisrubri TaxID=207949 RepID=Q1N3V3_9GAMM|nr:acetate--CoA ligase [Bermanella marisrubri]EAT12771.1 acetyl-coenzyme A synthetase [Oceanobacter sp. RED65] [Bermanella marisrubri]QIZ83100.1 acetate--CoA ligase [Bermanella marisrubri]